MCGISGIHIIHMPQSQPFLLLIRDSTNSVLSFGTRIVAGGITILKLHAPSAGLMSKIVEVTMTPVMKRPKSLCGCHEESKFGGVVLCCYKLHVYSMM